MIGFMEHNPRINEFMQGSAEQMQFGIMMVALSIQQRWSSVGEQMKSYKAGGGSSRFVWGNKRKTHDWLEENRDDLYVAVMGESDPEKILLSFLECPGLGLAKAGFCCQLMFGFGGCMDTHNLQRFGIKPIAWSNNLKQATKEKKAKEYLHQCIYHGGCEELWNSWCYMIAQNYPNDFADGEHVSAVHLTYLTDAYNNVITEAV